ncbi:MAG: PAS domain S-box protein [Chloroflexota bacterium]|nr:PAS domain S-box protein [Chloroflexota bacterium]
MTTPLTTVKLLKDFRRRVLATLERQRQGHSTVVEYRIVRPDGSIRWIRNRAFPIWDAQGKLDRITGVAEDITEHKRVEREIEERRSYLESVLACAPDAIVTLDDQHNVLEWNPGAERLFGYTLQEATGRNIDDLITGPDANVLEEAAGLTRLVLAGGSVPLTEMIRYKKDGSPVNVISSASPILIEDKVIGMVAVYTDITERKQIKQQLQQQERLAAVGQLAAGIAHDFNNLLTTIMLYSQMSLRKPDLPPKIVRSFETILDESRQAAELVQQILDFSRRAMLKVQPLDLGSFAGKVVDILRRAIPENIHLVLEIGPEECIVEADPTRIQQALMNLATNGRDAMPEGGELRFELSRTRLKPGDDPPVAGMSPGEWACLAVSDTGTGMTEEAQAHLFEPFFTTKEVGKGTGLGLAQVYGTIRQHEGYIGVETEIGKGTTFRIYLPASEAEEKVAEAEIAAPPRGQGETILLVEDSENLLQAGRAILESLGYRVLTAPNGREALAVYEAEGGVDLVITDLVMPEMGGRQLMQKLKQVNPGLKGLAITGYALQKASQELKETIFLDVIHKPFNVRSLAHIVRRALDAGNKSLWR